MKLTEQLAIGWKVCVTASAASWAIGGISWTAYRHVDDWVRAQDADSAQLVELVKRVNRLEDDARAGARNTETHCRLGTLPPEWCADQGFKVPAKGKGG